MAPDNCELAARNEEKIISLETTRAEDLEEAKRKSEAIFKKLNVIEQMLYGRPAWTVLIVISLLTGAVGVLATALIHQ